MSRVKHAFLAYLIGMAGAGYAQPGTVDPVAIDILDNMSQVIGDLGSCSYKLNAWADHPHEYGLEKDFMEYEVYFGGPQHLKVHSNSRYGHRGFWYDGETFTYYSFAENNYSTIPAPHNVIDMIDSLNAVYEVDFPAADFFYPSFTDDLIDYFETITYLGEKEMREKSAFHIMAANDQMIVQIWVTNDGMNLPAAFTITYKQKAFMPQYTAVFSDWQLNPDLPVSLFSFSPPPGAREIVILPKTAQ